MSITDRLEEAIINARIAAGLTGVTQQPVGISQDDAVRILAALRWHRMSYSLDEIETLCAGCEAPWPCETARRLQPDTPIVFRTPDERAADAATALARVVKRTLDAS